MNLYSLACYLSFLGAIAAGPQDQAVELVKAAPATYPPIALAARIEGNVVLRVTVERDGSVASIKITEGSPLLYGSTMDSVRASEFRCAGCTKRQSIQLVYAFRLSENCKPEQDADNAQAAIDRVQRITVNGKLPCAEPKQHE